MTRKKQGRKIPAFLLLPDLSLAKHFGLVIAGLAFYEVRIPRLVANPTFWLSLLVFALIALILIFFPLKRAGKPEEPAPPSAVI
jgi:magnesium-transporting ATPase (P-type)